jgi:hypothetical protein
MTSLHFINIYQLSKVDRGTDKQCGDPINLAKYAELLTVETGGAYSYRSALNG